MCLCFIFCLCLRNRTKLSIFLPTLQDFLGQAHFTLGEVVGSLGSRSEKPLGWVGVPIAGIVNIFVLYISIIIWQMMIDGYSKRNQMTVRADRDVFPTECIQNRVYTE